MEGGAFPGAELCADLTKAVVTASSWEAFRIAVGLTKCRRNSSSMPRIPFLESAAKIGWH